ncbi:MAG TPA: hypothetical protein VLN47_05980 [Clostridiaceae bacterium]|nr:hypothetical protein [Clostridiaceae bacterium]
MDRKNLENIREHLKDDEAQDLQIDPQALNSFDESNLEKYNQLKLKEKNLEIEKYETEYIDPFDGNKVKDITDPHKETGHETIEDFITSPRQKDAGDSSPTAEIAHPFERHDEHDELPHTPLEEAVDQLDDEAALVQENADSHNEAANLNKYDAQNLKERNLIITQYETEYLDPEDGYTLKDIRETHPSNEDNK